jgi:hypothetical protein
MVTSSLNEISTDQLGVRGGSVIHPATTPFLQQLSTAYVRQCERFFLHPGYFLHGGKRRHL